MHLDVGYMLVMLAALIAASIARRHVGGAAPPLTPRQRAGLALSAFVGGMIGAKLPYLFGDWEALASGTAWLGDGRTILWGFAGGYASVEVAKPLLGIRHKTGDTFAFPVAVAVSVGRLACFVGGCCFGRPTEVLWAVDFGDGVPRHPTQIYESLFHAGAAFVLYRWNRPPRFVHQHMKLYLMGYAIYRFFSEYLRPEPIVGAGLTFYQWSALLLFTAMGALMWRELRASKEMAEPRALGPK